MGRPRKDKRQRLLEQSGLTRSSAPEAENENGEESNRVGERKRVYVRSYCPSWKLLYPWSYSTFDEERRERIKCSVCSEMQMATPFGRLGGTTIQKQALAIHHASDPHKLALQRKKLLAGENIKHIEKHVELLVDSQKSRIINVIQIMYRVAQHDLPLEAFEDECKFHMYMKTPNMPLSCEYSAYINPMAGKDFLSAMYLVYWEKLKDEIGKSPFYSILVDESSDRRFEKHVILYITYLKDGGNGSRTTSFVKLISVDDGKAITMYNGIQKVLENLDLSMSKMVALGSDGAAAMVGSHSGLFARLRAKVPHLVGVHCIAHREALVVKDTCDCFAEMKIVDRFASHVQEWIGDSCLRRAEVRKLMLAFLPRTYEILKIHGVRWLSRGNVMKRLAKVMPALLECWKPKYPAMYKKAASFQMIFLIYFMADVMKEINVLNIKFQGDEVDITMIGREIDVLLTLLKARYLDGVFANGSKHLSPFLNGIKNGVYAFQDKSGQVHQHVLNFMSLLDEKQEVNLEECTDLAKAFIHRLISNFEDRYQDHHLFNAAKLFSPKNYSKDAECRGQNVCQYLLHLCDKFGAGENPLIQRKRCEGELQRFVLNLFEAYPSKGLLEAWDQCGGEQEWMQMFPAMFKLWQIVVVLPASSAACERGFSKQNRVKSNDRSCLCLITLDMLMFMSLSAPKQMHEVDWDLVFDVWKSMKKRRTQVIGESTSNDAIG